MTGQWRSEEVGTDPLWVDDDDLYADERSSSYPPDTLVTLRFLWDAVRRHVRVWVAIALVGLAAGLALPAVLPPTSTSSARLLLTHRDGDDPARAMATDASLVTTHTVAEEAIQRLSLTETPDDLLQRYTATPLTDRMLEITVVAPTSAQATEQADALAHIFLAFRRDQIALQIEPLRADLASARRAVSSAEDDVRATGDNPRDLKRPTSTVATKLIAAREKQQYIEQQILDQQVAASRMNSSRLLDPAAPVPHSAKMALVVNAFSGLVAGLFIGIGFVVVRALVSDRLWRRQDIARALGAPVRLSVGRPPRWRWRSYPRYVRRSQMQKLEVRLAVRQLRRAVVWGETPKPALAVVSIDSDQAGALIVASLAMSFAEEGRHVLVADLSGGLLASALGVTKAGTHESRFNGPGVNVTVHRPKTDAGPAEGRQLAHGEGRPSSADDDALDEAWGAADLVLTLATLSPALGAEHLRTWSSRAAAVLTAGRSSTTKIHATGEMVRLAGLRLTSAVLLRADRTDESVGLAEGEEPSAGVGMIAR